MTQRHSLEKKHFSLEAEIRHHHLDYGQDRSMMIEDHLTKKSWQRPASSSYYCQNYCVSNSQEKDRLEMMKDMLLLQNDHPSTVEDKEKNRQ